MTVTVPSLAHGNSVALAAEVAALSARTDAASQNRCKQQQEALVFTLLSEHKLAAATILNTVTINAKTHPLWAQRTTLQALVISYGATMPGTAAGVTLDQVERQLVAELMASGQVTGATILAHPSLSYIGAAAI